MKRPKKAGLKWLTLVFIILALFLPFSGVAQDDANDFSWLELLPPGCCLDSWSFEGTTNWYYSDFGFAPLNSSNIEQVPDWDGNALQMDSTNAAWLTYAITENAPGYGEYTNLTLGVGSIEFLFLPNWQSDDTNFYGSGPNDWGRFIEAGTWEETNDDSDWWSLYLNPHGTGIYFSSGTNGVRTNYLSAPISWGNTWNFIVLTFSPTNSFLYLNGQLAASGDGVRYVPSGNALTNGFSIGSDFATGMQQIHGQVDDLLTYNYQLSAGDISNDYAEVSPKLPGSFGGFQSDDEPPLPGGGDGGSGSGGGGVASPSYGSNLWVAVLGMTNEALSLLETNTESDVLYELQGCTNLASPNWTSFGFVNGSELTNCTPAIAPIENNGTMFYRVRSWQGVDGIPLWWFYYFGLTNISGEAFSPSGDGWTLLQCFEAGISPTNFVTPPAPQGLTITSYNTNGTATLSWMLSAGPVTGYVLQTPSGTNIVGSGVNSYTDNSSSESASYSIQAIYAGGLSAWSPSVSVEDFLGQQGSGESSLQNVAFFAYVTGSSENPYMAFGGIPTNAVTVQVSYIDTYGIGPTVTYDIPVSDVTNGIYQVPASWSPPSNDPGEGPYGGDLYGYAPYVQTMDSNGNVSTAHLVNAGNWGPPYFDGRTQMKQNVTFLLREPSGNGPFTCNIGPPPWIESGNFIAPSNYVYAGLYDVSSPIIDEFHVEDTNTFDDSRPFEDNYFYQNFVFSLDDVDTNGALTTGLDMSEADNNTLTFSSSPAYQFQQLTEQTNIPALLTANDTQWLITSPFQPTYSDYNNNSGAFYDLSSIGITYDFDPNNYYTVFSMVSTQNYFGLFLQSDNAAYVPADSNENREGNFQTNLMTINSSFEPNPYSINPYFYVQVVQPQFQTVEYDFWNTSPFHYYFIFGGGDFTGYNGSPLPGDANFSTTNKSDLLVASVADPTFQVAGYAKLAVTNGYPGVYAYLGQYLANAYEIDTNGNVTTNTTGLVSPYGQFFATEPGQAALVTMPDPDTGQQGTGVVDVIALNVDANHDGTMDFSFTGPDFVGPNNPYNFWVDDSQDVGDTTGTGIEEQGAQGNGVLQISGQYVIHGRRDLVNLFPVYVNIGSLFESNALTTGISYTDTNWQFVLSQGDGALRFAYTDLTPTNYMNYLLDTNESGSLAYDALSPLSLMNFAALTTVSDTGVALDPSFIADIATNNGGIILVEAWTNTTQPLVLTVYHGTNQVAQTSLYLSISEVEQMFRQKSILLYPDPNQQPDRLTTSSVPNEPPTNEKNFIFLHGYNVNPYQARGVAADMFKRLYWSGSHAKFWNVVWTGYDSQILDATTVNYHTNEVHACASAPAFTNFLATLTNGPIIVAAHSLGNMVVLSALNDYGEQNISSYFMIDAAIPLGAVQGNATPDANLYYPSWYQYADKLNASHWASLWPTTDGRSELTWSNRFDNLQGANVYNFYSSGEEVLREYTGGYPPSELFGAADEIEYFLENEFAAYGYPAGTYVWAWQDLLKGQGQYDGLIGSTHGGWRFNTNAPYSFVTNGVITQIPNSQATLIPPSQLQTNAFFDVTSPQFGNADLALFGSSGSSYAEANRNRILSDAIPELTLPIGANSLAILGASHNFDEQTVFENGWPIIRLITEEQNNNWYHSDFHQVAYTFTHQLFDEMVTLANLK